MIIQTNKPLPPRREHDFYPTPEWLVNAAFDLLPAEFAPQRILDPGAGDGVWGREARQRYPNSSLHGVELRAVTADPVYDVWCQHDFLGPGLACIYDLVIGNPPYREAEAFIRRGLSMLDPGGHLIYLLRLAFLEGQKRRDGLFRELPPFQAAVCSKRPSFTGDGKTNATAFTLLHWVRGYRGETRLSWLP